MSTVLRWPIVITVACAVSAISGFGAAATFDVPAFLKTHGHFTSEDIATIFGGGVVVKSLSADDSAVAFCAAVRIAVPTAFYVERLRDIESFKRAKDVLQIGRFDVAPTAGDMRSLTIGNEDLKDLRECRPGNCDVKLDAAGIRRLASEAGSATTANAGVTAAMREHLAAYAAAYMNHGNSVLMEYHHSDQPTRLSSELHLILQHAKFLKDDLTVLARAVGAYDGSSQSDVDHFLYWSKEKLGSKPIISITHVLITTPHDKLTAIATKQIYASHYFNASLGITLLADATAAGGPPHTLLIYVSRSRLDVFEGLLGGLKRPVVRSRVRKGAAKMLRDLRERLERHYLG